MSGEGRRPVSALGSFSRGEIKAEPEYIKKQLRDQHPDQGGSTGLGIGRVVLVDYEEHYVTLRTQTGTEQEFHRVPVPLTYPGAGARHFLGAMPEVGDYCVLGWLAQDTSEGTGTKTPVILTWIVPGVWPGRDWLTTANFTEDEHDGGSSRSREELRGVFDRVRHKLRHIQPGNIVASSAQGSDLVLDEGVHLVNRRGNEFLLRDADQAVITRALQQFTALAGTRTYSGMVQRDALRLPTTMFSDGLLWDSELQGPEGVPVPEEDLGEHPTAAKGFLTPADGLSRVLDADLSGSLESPPDDLNPYVFLRNGGYIDEHGHAVDAKHLNDATYAGKNIYRVMAGSQDNGVLQPEAGVFTEHRLEIAHTSNGVLPVTEQTDGFDAERLPPSDPDTPGESSNKPFIECVLGTVVGNDPYSAQGRQEYGLPMVAEVFDALGNLSPRIRAARIASSDQEESDPLTEHAATLFKLTPITGKLAPTWWSVNKKGQVRVNLSGAPNEFSLDAALAGGMRVAVGGRLELILQGGIHFGTNSKHSLRLRSDQGPVVIYGGGPAADEEAAMEREYGTSGGDGELPAVDIVSRTSTRIQAERAILVKGQKVELNASSVKLNALDEMELTTSKQIAMACTDLKTVVNGKQTDTYMGPKNALPTNGALHERSYNPLYAGLLCEEVTYLWGDREETFKLGNHTTHVVVGNMTYKTDKGTWKAQAGTNTLTLDSTEGLKAQVVVGDVSLTATAGSAQMKASVSALVDSTGPATLRSKTLLRLGAPISGPDQGPIICAGSLEPFTHLPYLTWGMGAKNHLVGV